MYIILIIRIILVVNLIRHCVGWLLHEFILRLKSISNKINWCTFSAKDRKTSKYLVLNFQSRRVVIGSMLQLRPRIPQIRVSNTRLAQAASDCAPSVDVLPIFDVKQQSVRNPARMGANHSLVGVSYNKRLGYKESPLPAISVWGIMLQACPLEGKHREMTRFQRENKSRFYRNLLRLHACSYVPLISALSDHTYTLSTEVEYLEYGTVAIIFYYLYSSDEICILTHVVKKNTIDVTKCIVVTKNEMSVSNLIKVKHLILLVKE
ncbi:hypothetical protein WN51_08316 [Melipona quadrifasciata]|uniref:Uncharacterized protein n=1 Tax=Melipona quadrifasciata TaxID=166423 RepID=A0A0M9A9T7_9HYME|nr:hypothetical protein WN51_08316 [Melipona quadrifasciata]